MRDERLRCAAFREPELVALDPCAALAARDDEGQEADLLYLTATRSSVIASDAGERGNPEPKAQPQVVAPPRPITHKQN